MAELRKKAALLSNITVDLVISKLRRKYDFYTPGGFDAWIQEIIDPASGLYNEKPDAVIVLLDGTESRSWKSKEEGIERIAQWKQAVSLLASRITSAPVFLPTLDIRENKIRALSERSYKTELEDDWYQFIQGKAEETDHVFIFDLADLIIETGRKTFYSDKMWYLSSMPYSRDGLGLVCAEIDRILSAAFSPRRKIIALDLDNTIWGGVVGEAGMEGIELADHKEGQRFYDFQRRLLEMKRRGVLLAVDSRNNEEDAEEVLQKHPAMLLRDDDFVSRKINWNNKAENIREMEEELNLTESGFVFVDDNPIERETVKGECPEVIVPDFPEDTTELASFAEELWADHFRPLRVLDEDLSKTRMYLNEADRRKEMKESLNLDDYIARIEMRADIHKMRPQEKARVLQLLQKTNQFNVTTKRYTQTELDALEKDPQTAIYVTYSADKYGDSGLVSVIILKEEGETERIDTFLMSCRVMGRKLEDVIIQELSASMGRKMIGEYIPTPKNAPVKELFDRLGFRLVSEEEGHKVYELPVDHTRKNLDCYKEIRFEQ